MLYPVYRLFRLQTSMLFNICMWHYYNYRIAYAILIWIGAVILEYAMLISCLSMLLYKPGELRAAPAPDWFLRPIFKYASRGYKKEGATHTVERYEWRKLLGTTAAFFENLPNFFHTLKIS